MRIVKQKSKRKGYERLWDYYLVWVYNDKVYTLRVNPTFATDKKLLFAIAETAPTETSIEDYVLPPC